MRGMCKVVCAMGFGPIGFMASFVSCDETSVRICGQTTVESTGCIHVSRVLGVAQAVYILDRVCAVFSPEWYMSSEHSNLSSFSKHFSLGFLCSGDPAMRQLRKRECVHIQKKCACVRRPPWCCS